MRALSTAPFLTICALLSSAVSACSSVAYDEDIAARVARIDAAGLREHVARLEAIGPRPVSDDAATRATVDALANELRALGYELFEEVFELELTSRLVARVRPLDQPDAELSEIDLGPSLGFGKHVMRSASRRLASDGWQVESFTFQSSDDARTLQVPNLIATKRGTVEPERVLELGAHYDTVPHSPGAVDNASGVAALLEIARVVADVPTGRSVRFCFFGAEEVGKRGSAAHIAVVRADSATAVAGLINLDSVGYADDTPGSQAEPDDVPWFLSLPDRANFVAVVGNWSSGWLGNLVEDAIDVYAPELPYYSANRIGARFADAQRSDHANYWAAELDATWLTDMGEFRNDAYHSPRDTSAIIDFEFLTSIARATAAATLHWAGRGAR